jgi:hypothetical protein
MNEVRVERYLSSPSLSANGTFLHVYTGVEGASLITFVSSRTFSAYNSSEARLGLTALNSDKYSLKKPIPIVIQEDSSGEYIVSFPDAELSRSGSSADEAVEWLQSSIVTLYDLLRERAADGLGPRTLRQRQVLGEYLVEKSGSET